MAKLSTRKSSTARRKASSPLESSDAEQPDPPARRVTRSQSIDLDAADDDRVSRTQGPRRSARQLSVESNLSNASASSSRLRQSKKGARVTVIQPELSMVAENDDEEELGEEEEEPAESDEEDFNEDDMQYIETEKLGSPTAYSQISGTTEVTSASLSLMDLEVDFVEDLPDLLTASRKILDQLAPPDTTEADVGTLMTELKKVGSTAGKRLNHREEKFDIDMRKIGLDGYDEEPFTFIRIDLMLGKLFRAEDLTSGDYSLRPDAIFQAANLATMVRHFVAAQRESRRANTYLARLDDAFPQMFVSHFNQEIQFGNSDLLESSFQLALEIRTQLTVTDLLHGKDREDWNPEQMLADNFFNAPDRSSTSKSYYQKSYDDGVVRPILMSGDSNSIAQNKAIKARVRRIRQAFGQSSDAVEAGDLVNFESLMAEFPWTAFITNLVQWSRLRLDEIDAIISAQGGIEQIMEAIIPAVEAKDSQVEIVYRPTPSAVPAQSIKPALQGRSFLGAGYALEKRIQSAKARKSSPGLASTAARSLPDPFDDFSAASRSVQRQDSVDFSPDLNNHLDQARESPSNPNLRPPIEYVQEWEKYEKDQNKENILGQPQHKRRLIDPQPNAIRLQDSDDEADVISYKGLTKSKSKRSINQTTEDEEEEEAFESDVRAPDPKKRNVAPARSYKAPSVGTQASRRSRIEPNPEADREAERIQNQNRAQQALDSEDGDVEFDEDNFETPPPTAREVKHAARSTSLLNKKHTIQSRVPWSEHDEQHLIELIEEHGCVWATIAKFGEWERGDQGTNQVGLKDKAHNIKVSYLKARVPPPHNFDQIKLRKKELDAVRLVDPGYEE